MKASLTAIAAMIVSAHSAIAAPVAYTCSLDNQDSSGWIAPQYVFNIESGSKHVSNTTRSGGIASCKLRVDRKGNFRIS